jgi:hypothetical protein
MQVRLVARGIETGSLAVTASQEFREFALDCGKQAAAAEDETLRRALLDLARLWMDAAWEQSRVDRSATLLAKNPITVTSVADVNRWCVGVIECPRC